MEKDKTDDVPQTDTETHRIRTYGKAALRCFSICPFAYPYPNTTGSRCNEKEGPFPYVRYDCVTVSVVVHVYFGSLHDPIGTTKRMENGRQNGSMEVSIVILHSFPCNLMQNNC